MYVLCANISKHYGLSHSSYLSSLYMRLHMTACDWSPQNIREEMESFVSDVALLELEPAHQQETKRQELYKQHQHQMNVLFDYIYTSDIWSDGMASAMEELLLSSLLEYFDMGKMRTLVHVYQQTTDANVRQRALIGWVLALGHPMAAALYPELPTLIDHLLEDGHCREELAELQKQIVFCINTDQDTRTIQQEIMPELIKNQDFRITPNGIVENEEDPMEDILNPGSEERKIEKMEESIQKMAAMQKQGSDVYFAGFSQMKLVCAFLQASSGCGRGLCRDGEEPFHGCHDQ